MVLLAMPPSTPLQMTEIERAALETRCRARSGRSDDARRARVLLMLADGATHREVAAALSCSIRYVARWRDRFLDERLGGLYGRHSGKQPSKRTVQLEARILERTRRKPQDGSTHWSTRKLAKELGVSHMMVARVWARAGIKPHRLERYTLSNDPNFEAKAADIIGLYVNPPQHAAVFCVDEKTAIQALDRLDPVLPLSPGRAERHGFEYFRHGTLSLYGALNTKTGAVMGRTVSRHTSAEFVAFLAALAAANPDTEIHVIADNLSAHKSARVQQFLAEQPRVKIHFTPTYSSWLNQIELWFAKVERDVIARGIFTSVKDLARKLMRYIRRYNTSATPVKWTYSNPSRRILPPDSLSPVTGH